MRLVVTGATGLIGSRLVAQCRSRGDEVTALSRDTDAAQKALGVPAVQWNPEAEPAPPAALAGTDAVIHLAGENLAQRWTDDAKRGILDSRELGTANLIAGIRAAQPRPATLVSGSAVGYYGAHGADPVDESSPPGSDFAAEVCVAWERKADEAAQLGLRVVKLRTGVVLAPHGGALAKMLPLFKLGVGGPVGGGHQYMPWVHIDDVVGMILAAIGDRDWEGPINVTAPEPVTNKAFSRALGSALGRPAIAPVPSLAIKLLYGEMSKIVLTGQNAVPQRALALGYRHLHADLDSALTDVLDGT